MAEKAVCKSCRYFRETSGGFFAWCGSPRATTIDRVRGPMQPRLDVMVDPETIEATTDRCDREGWFEPHPRPWWRVWP